VFSGIAPGRAANMVPFVISIPTLGEICKGFAASFWKYTENLQMRIILIYFTLAISPPIG
jgi:hypothetical protein